MLAINLYFPKDCVYFSNTGLWDTSGDLISKFGLEVLTNKTNYFL